MSECADAPMVRCRGDDQSIRWIAMEALRQTGDLRCDVGCYWKNLDRARVGGRFQPRFKWFVEAEPATLPT
jgi:hypothetical protein